MSFSASTSSYGFEDTRKSDVAESFPTMALTWLLIVAIVFINAADFRGADGAKFEVHWQIFLRLGVCAACGALAILLFSKAYREFLTMPGMLISLLVTWIGVTVPFSIDKSYSIAAYISLGSVVALIPAAMKVLGGYRFLLAIACGLLLFLMGSWVAYLFVPEVGIFKEQVTRTEVVERMGGLGHPNELGFYSAFTVIIFATLGYGRRLSWIFAGPAMLFALVTLVVCFSRTSMVITILGLLVLYKAELFKLGTILWACLLPIFVIPILFGIVGSGQLDWIIEDFATKISKSGSSDELSTATGRTEIWAYGIERIAEQPLYGYGYGTARFVMADYSYHCHNIILNMSMYTGVIGGLIVTVIILYFIYQMLANPRYEVDAMVAMIIAGGMVEGLLVSPVPHVTVCIWVAALFWRQLDMSFNPQVDKLRRPENPRSLLLPAKSFPNG